MGGHFSNQKNFFFRDPLVIDPNLIGVVVAISILDVIGKNLLLAFVHYGVAWCSLSFRPVHETRSIFHPKLAEFLPSQVPVLPATLQASRHYIIANEKQSFLNPL